MDAQVLLVFQEEQHGVRNGADAQLQGVPVLDQLGAVAPNGLFHRADLRRRKLDNGLGVFHEIGNLLHRNQLPVSKGHLLVHLSDDGLCRHDGFIPVVHGDAQRHHAVLIRRGHGNKGHINGQSGMEQLGNLVEKAGGKVAPSAVNGVPGARAGKAGIMPEVRLHARQAVLALAHGHHVHDLYVFIVLCMGHQSIQQIPRFTTGMAHHDTVARFDVPDRLGGGDIPLLIVFTPIHTVRSFVQMC